MIRKLMLAVVIAGVWLAYFTGLYIVYRDASSGAADFGAYYLAAKAFNTGGDPYSKDVAIEYLYPPLLAQLLAGITAVADQVQTEAIWYGLNVILLAVAFWLISRQLWKTDGKVWVWVLPPLFAGTYQCLLLGQAGIVLFVLAVAAWAAYREDRPWLTGVWIALGAWVKLYPGFLLIYFLYKRDWRVLGGAVVASLAVIVFQSIISGPALFFRYITEVLPTLITEGLTGQDYLSSSVISFSRRLFVEVDRSIVLIDAPALFPLVRFGIILLLIGSFLWVARPADRKQFDLEYCLVLMFSLLMGSTLHPYGMVSLLLVYLVVAYYLPDTGRLSVWGKVGLVTAFVFADVHFLLIIGTASDYVWRLPALTLSLGFFSIMIVWVIIIWQLKYLQRDKL